MDLFRSRHRQELEQLAYKDRVTGLPLRERFEEDYSTLSDGGRGYVYIRAKSCEYRRVRENFGQETADRLLCDMAGLFQKELREDESLSRMAGGAFALLVRQESNEKTTARLIRLHEMLLTLRVTGHILGKNVKYNYPLTFLLAAVVLDGSGRELQELEGLADMALLLARFKHRAFLLYDPASMEEESRCVELIRDIDRAFEEKEFVPYIQPEYSFATDKVVGGEVVARWQHPQAGVLMPEEFLPLLEFNGRIFDLDMLIFETVCQMFQKWIQKELMPVPFSVNISKLTFYRAEFVEQVTAIAQKYNIPPVLVLFEIDEEAIFESPRYAAELLEKLHQAGFRLLLDDFGGGTFSSLRHVGVLPIDGIKPGLSFFSQDLGERECKVLENMLHLAAELHMTVLFTKVETKEQAELIKRVGGKYAQGFLYQKPFPIEEFEEMIFQSE